MSIFNSAIQAAQLKFPSFKPGSKNKKEDPKTKTLSENVKKFLANKEAEKRKADELERLKKQKLLQLRSQDKKATKRVGQMLRMTKSANKSVIADAVNCLNDSLAEQGVFYFLICIR
jgi:protein SPT2